MIKKMKNCGMINKLLDYFDKEKLTPIGLKKLNFLWKKLNKDEQIDVLIRRRPDIVEVIRIFEGRLIRWGK